MGLAVVVAVVRRIKETKIIVLPRACPISWATFMKVQVLGFKYMLVPPRKYPKFVAHPSFVA